MTSRLTVVLVSLLLATPAVAFWLWLVIVPARVAILCPEGCECFTGGFYVKCNSLSVNPIPLIHLTDVQVLLLYGNNITLLEKDSFVSKTELLLLYVGSCKLRTIQLGALNGLTKLTRLSLHSNNITEIMPGTFENLSSLERLDLSNNNIKHLNGAVFSGLGAFSGLTKLTHLLMHNNEISDILPGTFENMSNLERLDLCYNEITEIMPSIFGDMSSLECLDLSNNNIKDLNCAVFTGLVKLKHLHLSANQLQYLHPYTFLGLPNIKRLSMKENMALKIPTDRYFNNSHSLSELDIASCNVSSLSVETFANVSALELLDLRSNNLKIVDMNILKSLPKLSKLYLYGNRLQCACQLQEVWRWCETSNIETAVGRWVPECDTPSRVNGMWWGVLEKGQCFDGNIKYFGDYKNVSYNETDIGARKSEYGNDDEFFKQYQVPVYAVPYIFGTIGNVILLIIIICNKDMRTVPNMYILNLAISDIIYLAILFSEAFAYRKYTTRANHEFLCIFEPFCRRMSVGLSAYSVALYSFQRYRVTVRPIQVRVSSQPKWRGIVATFCGVWTVAALFAVPSALSKYLCQELIFSVNISYYKLVVVFELLVSCAFPLCVIAFFYVMTARHLVESSRSISEGTQNPQLKTRRNAAKIVLGLTVVFVISYVPYHVFWTYFIISNKYIFSYNINDRFYSSDYKVRYTYLISNGFLSINPCLNPVALFCTSSHFRQHLKRYLTCFCKTSSPSTDFELTRSS